MAKSAKGDCHSPHSTGTIAPMSAPIVSWPSAPIFHTFALKHTAKPTPINTNGPALTNTSSIDHQLVKGSIKYRYSAVKGGLPIIAKIRPPITIVKKIANTGDHRFIMLEAWARFSKINCMLSSSRSVSLLMGSCHHQTYLLARKIFCCIGG